MGGTAKNLEEDDSKNQAREASPIEKKPYRQSVSMDNMKLTNDTQQCAKCVQLHGDKLHDHRRDYHLIKKC